jgi:hypothetical protein
LRFAGLTADAGQARPSTSSSFVKFRQVSSSFVKQCQAMSSFVKTLLDGALCNFNGLRGTSLTAGPAAGTRAADSASTDRGHETRIAQLSAPAKKMSDLRAQGALRHWPASLAGSAVDLMGASFFPSL